MKNTLILLVVLALISGCSSQKSASKSYSSTSSSKDYQTQKLNLSEKSDRFKTNERKIIYNANLYLTVKNPDTVNRQLVVISKKYSGYVQSLGTHQSIIRILSDSLHKAIQEIAMLGKMESKSIRGEDITDEFTDYQIRLDNAEKARKRYLDLLDKAENVESALRVEKELERLNGEIEIVKGKMSKLNHLTEFSTITVNLKEKVKPGILGYIFIGLYKSVKWLFVRN